MLGCRVRYFTDGAVLGDMKVDAIHKRFTYCMQDWGEFMKGLLQRF